MELQIIAACCSILHQSKNSSTISAPFNTFKILSWLSKPFLLSPHACGPHATSCNLWKLIQWSLAPRQPLDYLNAHLTMPWNCQSLQHIATYCSILQQSKNSFLSPSSSQVQNSAKLPLQHHFSTIQHLQAAVLAFKPSSLSPHACGPHATSCNLLKLIQGSLTPRPPLDYLNAHLTMPWNCKSLQHVAAFCTKARTAAPFQHHSTLSRSCPGFQSLSSCLLMLVDHMQHPATCGN